MLGQAGALTADPDTAVRFTGSPSTGNVVVPNSTSLGFGDGVSFEGWVKLVNLPPSGSTGANLLTKNSGSLLMRILPSGVLALRKSGGAEIAASTVALSADGRFHHLVGTKSGPAVRLYVDGVDVTGPVANQTLTNNTNQLVIGHNPISTNDGLDGYIDEVALYNRELSGTEVGQHYNLGRQPGCHDITGANAKTYSLTAQDVGSSILVAITATNSAGADSASSARTVTVTAANTWTSHKDQPIGNAGVAPTGSKPESKLWWNDGAWWSSMWSVAGNGFHIFRLELEPRRPGSTRAFRSTLAAEVAR